MNHMGKKIISIVGWALKIVILVPLFIFLIFYIYCYTVTYVTPYVYENYCIQKVGTSSVSDTLKVNDILTTAKYSDDYNNSRIGVLGTFGDSSGFMNAFFSLLAFTAVVLTFGYQFRNDRKNKRLSEKSEFESVFFNMTSTLEDIVSHLEYHDTGIQSNLFAGEEIHGLYPEGADIAGSSESDIVYKGRDIFRYLYSVKPFTLDSGEVVSGIKEFIDNNEEMTMSEVQEKVFDGSLDHYFRYAYRILKYIDKSDLIDKKDKDEYAAVLRAQFSCYELFILLINCIEMDNNKFKKLIEQYCMFNNVRIDFLPDSYKAIYASKVRECKEREGYEANASIEYSVTAFCKEANPIRVSRLETFQRIWELRISRRVEEEREV